MGDSRLNENPKRIILQNFLVVWLDTCSSILSDDFHQNIISLRRIVNDINRFTNVEQGINFISSITEEKVFVIVSPTLGEQIVPRMQAMTQVDSIYLLRNSEVKDDQSWIGDWSKVKGVFGEIASICSLLQEVADQYDADYISISVLSTEDIGEKSINELEPSFMYTEILKEILFEVEYSAKSINDFIEYIRPLLTKPADLKFLGKFEKGYQRKDAIWWYTCECFIYRFLNRYLREQDIGSIIKIGFFIRDLHQQIGLLHSQQLGKELPPSLTVYRGQSLPTDDFEKLRKTPNGLLSFNCFLSTSVNRKVSLNFGNKESKPGRVSALFEITINTETPSSPYALVSQLSEFKNEEEILFAAHTVFRVGEISPVNGQEGRWLIKLTLISSTNSDLAILTKYLREETVGSTGWHRLGILLMKIAEYEKAEQVFQESFLSNDTDELEKALIDHHLGWVKRKLGAYEEALEYYERALEIRQRILPASHPDVASSYNAIGDAYRGLGEHPKALQYYEEGLEMRQNTLSSNHPDLAVSYNNIGDIYNDMSEFTKALSFYRKGLAIRQASLPSNHPDLATSHNNIGDVYCNMGEYTQARACYEVALGIIQKTLPPNHPDFASFYNNLGIVYFSLSEYTTALSYYDKVLAIWLKTSKPDHPNLISAHNNKGVVHMLLGQYSEALSCYEEALKICEKSRPKNHADFGICYNNLGQTHYKLGQYEKALSFYKLDLQHSRAILSENHIDLAASYNSLGQLHFSLGEYPKALAHYDQAVAIFEKALLLNHPDLVPVYKNIGNVHTHLGNYSQALAYHEKALEICLTSLSDSHPHLATSYNNIGLVKFHLGEHSSALSYYEKALRIRRESLPADHPDLTSSYDNIASWYNAKGEYAEALSQYGKSLEIYEKVFPDNHPILANYYTNLGAVHQNLRDYSKAIPAYTKALQIRRNSLSVQHPDLITAYKNISRAYASMGEHARALAHQQQATAYVEDAPPNANHDCEVKDESEEKTFGQRKTTVFNYLSFAAIGLVFLVYFAFFA